MVTIDEILAARAGKAYDNNGEKVGAVGEVYLDDTTGYPAWVTVNTGFFGTSESFVPLEGAVVQGENLHLPYSKEMIKEAPIQDADRHLEAEDEERLYEYYGLSTAAPIVAGSGDGELGESRQVSLRLLKSRRPGAAADGEGDEVRVSREPLNVPAAEGTTLSEHSIAESGASSDTSDGSTRR